MYYLIEPSASVWPTIQHGILTVCAFYAKHIMSILSNYHYRFFCSAAVHTRWFLTVAPVPHSATWTSHRSVKISMTLFLENFSVIFWFLPKNKQNNRF